MLEELEVVKGSLKSFEGMTNKDSFRQCERNFGVPDTLPDVMALL